MLRHKEFNSSSIFSHMNVDPFIVVNVGNTCYIDSLLIALFYSPSTNDYLLNTDIQDGVAMCLQEIIKVYFVNRIRIPKSVTADCIDMIRNYCFQLGWLQSTTLDTTNTLDNTLDTTPVLNPTSQEMFCQQDVSELYHFLIDKFNGEQIKIQIETITEALKSDDDIGKASFIPYIPLSLPTDPNCKDVSVKKLLHDWMYDNLKEVDRYVMTPEGKIKKRITALDVKHIINRPLIVALGINRFQNMVDKDLNKVVIKRNSTNVIIQKRISPFHNRSQHTITPEWGFHAAVCHRGNSINNGHYYCLLVHNKEYYIFDDMDTPCIRKVQMQDNHITDLIKKDCVFLIYQYSG